MNYLTCKACGCDSLFPVDVDDTEWEWSDLFTADEEDENVETVFYSCQVCGDNWLSIKEVDEEGTCQVTFIHQMGADPVLKRVASMQTSVVINDGTVGLWEYFSGEQEVEEEVWMDQLSFRRKILRSICSN